MIGPNHPVRGAFAGCSSGNKGGAYYISKDSAFSVFNATLKTSGYCLEAGGWPDCNGSIILDVWDNYGVCVGSAYFFWHKMPSGRWEVIGYIT